MTSAIIQQLETFGPQRCEQLNYEQAADYTRDLAASHYENFTVVSRLVPKRLHEDFANVYAFCRWADDLGDETGDPEQSLKLLSWWRRELAGCYADRPRHPVFVALNRTVRRHNIPPEPFEDLIDAFEQDQRVCRYRTWNQLVDYCTRSANPVGRLVLYMCGYRDAARQHLSDATCTALQLTNFWQDVRRDIIERRRIYVPAEDLEVAGLTHEDITVAVEQQRPFDADQQARYAGVMDALIERTQLYFNEGRGLWPTVARRVRRGIRLFTLGGEAVLHQVAQQRGRMLDERVHLSKAAKSRLMARVFIGHYLLPSQWRTTEPPAADEPVAKQDEASA